MRLSWADQRDEQEWDNGLLTGQSDPSRTERERDYDDQLEQADRRAEHGPAAYTERPSDRERREYADEARARNELRPRTGNVQAQPRRVPCTCGAAARGMRLAGPAHRYGCALHATRVDQEIQAA